MRAIGYSAPDNVQDRLDCLSCRQSPRDSSPRQVLRRSFGVSFRGPDSTVAVPSARHKTVSTQIVISVSGAEVDATTNQAVLWGDLFCVPGG